MTPDLPISLETGKFEQFARLTRFVDERHAPDECPICGYDRCVIRFSSHASAGMVICNNPDCSYQHHI